jgi:cytochrome c biogenesis protein ResB
MPFNTWQRYYRKFISIKTTIILLGILTFLYLLGTLFPQGREYATDGGMLLSIIKFFDLLHLFNSPLFIFFSLLFFLHLGLCTWDRLQRLWSRRLAISLDIEKAKSRAVVFPVPSSTTPESLSMAFQHLGFRIQKRDPQKGIELIEKGLSPQWLSLIYHIALFFCFIGFFITYFFAFEGEITLYPHQRQYLPDPSDPPRWALSWVLSGAEAESGITKKAIPLELELQKFSTEYIQLAKLDYPKDILSRIALTLGLPGSKPLYSAESRKSFFPKDWKSHLILYHNGKPVKEKTIEVNHPLHYKGLTFYQMAFEQELKLVVYSAQDPKSEEEMISVKSGEKFRLPSLPGYFKTRTLRLGTLYKKDGTQEKLVPAADLYYFPSEQTDKPKRIGSLTLNKPLQYEGISLILKDYNEASILSFRYDPGRPWLWLASVSLLFFMTLRIWGYWYRIIYWLEKRDDDCYLHYIYHGIGLGADESRLLNRLKYHLTYLV